MPVFFLRLRFLALPRESVTMATINDLLIQSFFQKSINFKGSTYDCINTAYVWRKSVELFRDIQLKLSKTLYLFSSSILMT